MTKHLKWKNKIKQYADKNNITAMNIAVHLGCHYETVKSWFYHRNNPNSKNIKELLLLFRLNDQKELFE